MNGPPAPESAGFGGWSEGFEPSYGGSNIGAGRRLIDRASDFAWIGWRDLILRTNATNWPADVAPSPAVQLTSFPLVLYRSRTEILCLHTNDRFAPMDETARAVERGGWRHSQYDGAAGRPVLG